MLTFFFLFFFLQTALPGVFHTLQELDDKRIKQVENFIRKGVDIERSVFPIINKCLDGIVRAADNVDPEKVTWLFDFYFIYAPFFVCWFFMFDIFWSFLWSGLAAGYWTVQIRVFATGRRAFRRPE